MPRASYAPDYEQLNSGCLLIPHCTEHNTSSERHDIYVRAAVNNPITL
ncbi:MAG: hypothetical protein U0694_18875 [Anaerolineae bacterium]